MLTSQLNPLQKNGKFFLLQCLALLEVLLGIRGALRQRILRHRQWNSHSGPTDNRRSDFFILGHFCLHPRAQAPSASDRHFEGCHSTLRFDFLCRYPHWNHIYIRLTISLKIC